MRIRFLIWVFDHVRLGRFAPYVFGLIIGRMPHKVGDK